MFVITFQKQPCVLLQKILKFVKHAQATYAQAKNSNSFWVLDMYIKLKPSRRRVQLYIEHGLLSFLKKSYRLSKWRFLAIFCHFSKKCIHLGGEWVLRWTDFHENWYTYISAHARSNKAVSRGRLLEIF